MSNNYSAKDIRVLKGLEAVRKRPGMYIGDTTDGSGLHHMVFEIVDNSVDEAGMGHCSYIEVCILADNQISVEDNGRGIPVDMKEEEGKSAAEIVMTELHAGGKFGDGSEGSSYKSSGGLHGVGASVVNALSIDLKLEISRDGGSYIQEYKSGVPDYPLKHIGSSDKHGTKITFIPSDETFASVSPVKFEFDRLAKRFREIAFLNKGLKVVLKDLRISHSEEYFYEGGIKQMVDYIAGELVPLHQKIFYFQQHHQDTDVVVEIAFRWNRGLYESDKIYCFTNNIPQIDGGTHLAGFKASLTRAINSYIDKEKLNPKSVPLTGEDCREGMIAVVSIRVHDPKFSSQTKDKLVSSEARSAIEVLLAKNLAEYLEENPKESKIIIENIINAARARESAKKQREAVRKQDNFDVLGLPGKLANCQEKDPEKAELFIVEGESAGGSAKQGRDRKIQAVLPLRGKILNVEKANIEQTLNSKEVNSLLATIGGGFGKEFDVSRVRYHKIIIMTDADVDGSHIRALLLNVFFKYMPQIIHEGYVYVARPPLYKVKKGNFEKYLQDDRELLDFSMKRVLEDLAVFSGDNLVGADKIESLLQDFGSQIAMITRIAREVPLSFLKALLVSRLDSWSVDALSQLPLEGHLVEFEKVSIKDGILTHQYNGLDIKHTLDDIFVRYQRELENMLKFNEKLNSLLPENDIYMSKKGAEKDRLSSLFELHDYILAEGKKGFYIQRYKGLGEMNPDQLWETTMDPSNRYLSRISIEDLDEAQRVFSIMMGADVEPRRQFIVENALNVSYLDV